MSTSCRTDGTVETSLKQPSHDSLKTWGQPVSLHSVAVCRKLGCVPGLLVVVQDHLKQSGSAGSSWGDTTKADSAAVRAGRGLGGGPACGWNPPAQQSIRRRQECRHACHRMPCGIPGRVLCVLWWQCSKERVLITQANVGTREELDVDSFDPNMLAYMHATLIPACMLGQTALDSETPTAAACFSAL